MNFYSFLAILATFVCMFQHAWSLELEAIDCKKLQGLVKLKNINDLYFPHEEECDMFYHCGPAGATIKPCGTGTIFSLRNKDCRRPENTKCISLEKWLEKKDIYLDDFYNEDY